MQLDIGLGDVVVPRALQVVYPTILDMSPPRIQCYSREATIAEKFEAITKLGIVNSRMKDFYDIWFLSRVYEFDGEVLGVFAQDPTKQMQWKAFVRKSRMEDVPAQLDEVIGCLTSFLRPVAEALATGSSFAKAWRPPGPWS
jgi:hypothetical protein